MVRPRLQVAEALFDQVADLAPQQRAPILSERCEGDPQLRALVERLLAIDDSQADGLLHRPACGALGGDEFDAAEPLPERIGRYVIVRRIAEGGMGIVYEARQEYPKRAVALKVIRSPLATRDVRRRFEHESEMLGQLQHPGIAQIYEAGVAELASITGRTIRQPYFAMELIRGEPLTAYARHNELGTRQRLELLAKVCDAVQHAHQKGLIHRDLKPANILVDESGQPKILDFGVARATESDVEAVTLHTDVGQLIGTIPYMSPEQVTGDARQLDTRSDVYSLGVTMYELLSRKLPHDVSGRSIPEAARTIRDTEPAALSSIDRTLRGDVQTICAKALEKDKTRRYQSAAALAEDIRRYLRGEPIEAKRDSALYVLRKQVARHRAAFAAGVAILLLLAMSSVVAWSLYVQADVAATAAQERLWVSLLDQARAKRQTTRAGRRFDALDAIARAARHRASVELRSEAMLCMSLVDLRVERYLERGEPWTYGNFTPSLEYYAVTDRDGGAVVRRVSDRSEVACFPPQGSEANFIWFSRDGRFLGVQYGRFATSQPLWAPLKVWDVRSPEQPAAAFDNACTQGFRFSPDSRRLYVGLDDDTLRVLSTDDFAELQRWPVEGGAFRVEFSPDGQRVLLSANRRRRLEVRNSHDGAVEATLDLTSDCWQPMWNPADGSVIVQCSAQPLRIWRPETGEVEVKRALGANDLWHWCFGRGGELALTSGWQHLSMIWDLPNERLHVAIPGHGWWFSPDDRHVGFVQHSFALEFQAMGIWEVACDRECRRLRIPGLRGRPRPAAVTPDGRMVCLPDPAGLTLWDARTGAVLALVPVDSGGAWFTPRGDSLITYDALGSHYWPVREEGGVLHLGPPTRVTPGRELLLRAINADRTHLVCTDKEANVLLVDLRDRTVVPSVNVSYSNKAMALSPDVRILAETMMHRGLMPESGVRVWSLETGELIRRLRPGHFYVEFSENGRFLLAHNQDEYYIWECATWEQVRHVSRSGEAPTTVQQTASGADAVPVGSERLIFLDPETTDVVLSLDIRLPDYTVRFLPRDPLLPITLDDEPYVLLYDMRLVRQRLRELGLDWDAPPYDVSPDIEEAAEPLRIEIHLGDLDPARRVGAPD